MLHLSDHQQLKIRLTLGFLLCCWSTGALAQFTTVTGTITDPNALPYASGTITAALISSSSPTLNGLAYSPPSQPTGLNSAGQFTMRLADNSLVSPGGSTWTFIVCSAGGTVPFSFGKGPQCFTVSGISVSGATQDVGATLRAAAPALTVNFGGGGIVSGSGTNGSIPLWNSSSNLTNSSMTDTTIGGPPAGGYVTFNHSLFGGTTSAALLFGNNTGAFTGVSSGCTPNTYTLCINQAWGTMTNTSNATGASIWNTFNGNTITGIGGGTFLNALELHNGQGVSATGAQTMPQQSTLYLQSGVTGYSATLDADLYIQNPILGVGTTMTHHYGIYVADQTGNSNGTNSDPWGIYIVHGKNQFGTGTGDTSFFGGLAVPPSAALASLPACTASTEGAHAVATNCNAACSAGTSCTAGGATHCELYCNSAAAYKETGLGN